jgi:hypothetical protein
MTTEDDIIAELQRDIGVQTDGQAPAGAQSLEEAKRIAREGFARIRAVLDERRSEGRSEVESPVKVQPRTETDRQKTIEEQIAKIKERLNQAA